MSQIMGKNWCFTINNYSDSDLQLFDLCVLDASYLIFGKEVGASGTPHLQGYIVFNSNKALTGVKKIHSAAHWEKAKGDPQSNRTYCSKEGDFVELGIMPMSQKRKGEVESERWELARKSAKSGDFDSIPADIYMRTFSACHKIHQLHQSAPASLGELQNVWLWGPAGSGKSARAFTENPGAYLKGVNKWWDGYTGQESVIVDDMDPFHKVLALEFKMWGQHQPFAAEVKGGSICIRPKKIIVTSNYRIDEVWEEESTRAAIHRRYTEIYIPSNKPCLYGQLIL